MTSWNPFTTPPTDADGERNASAPAHRPLGFADVRSSDDAAPPPVTGRAPIGFGPAPVEGTAFRTELSFRRQPRLLPMPPAVDLDTPPATLPVAGRSEPLTTGPTPPWTPLASADGDKVPFYKREITFRRRRDEQADDIGDAEVAPEASDAHVESPSERAPFGFAPSAGDDEHEPDEAPRVDPEPEPDPEPHVFAVEKHHEQEQEQEQEEGRPVTDEPPSPVDAAVEPDRERDDMVGATTPPPAPALADEHDGESSVEAVSEARPADGQPTKARRSLRIRPAGTPAPKKARGRGGRGSRKLVGLKIGASQLAAAVVVETDGRHELLEVARTPLESGIVVDGEVRDASALGSALRRFFDEHGLPKRDVRLGLSSNRIGVRTFEMGGIDDDERFDNAVRFKAHEVLPVSVHESVLDYRIVDERASETGEPVRRVFLVVAPRDQVEPYLSVCQDAGLRLAGIDLEALGLLRAFVDPRPFASRAADDTATVVVAIGHEVTTLLVAGGGSCEFTRVFDWGGETLQDAIAQELQVHTAEAATILRHLSLTGSTSSLASLDDESRAKALDTVRGRLTPFARELVSSLQFYQTQNESLGIGEIVITGGTSHLGGLAEALHQMIGVSVRVGDPLQRIVSRTALDMSVESAIGSLAVPIGLAIDDDPTRSVNLVPRDALGQNRRRPSLVKVAAPVAVAVPLVALAFMFVQANGTVSERESALAGVQAEIDALPEPKRPQIDPSLTASEAGRAAALASVLGGRVSWDGVLRDVSLVLPGNVSLTRLAAQLPEPVPAQAQADTTTTAAPVPVAPTGVEIEGYTGSQPSVARLLARLRTVPSLRNVQLQSSTYEEVGSEVIVRFVVLADMAGGAS
jgi:type IV pilus assembly protein PilM